MKAYPFVIALSLLLVACQSEQQADVQTADSDSSRTDGTDQTDQTKTLAPSPSAADDISTFPHNWVGLTKRGGDYVIYKPCDADNAAIAIVQADGRDVVQYVWGQEVSMYPITALAAEESGKTTINALTESEPQSPFAYTVEWIDSARGIALWKWEWDRGGEKESYAEYFTPRERAGTFATVVQPCTDCWSEEECAEMEKQQGN